ncbi:diaminobutyrate acetyltransferase [Albirhodobacter sp. R86504]|jgi:L-2,4-diaminobutyric acid acetyltransferase|uniref:diaminobutyrate acetyltransferase n=1 Tax=Albirhodobacter sp. R86504 TaxID=3093848 RepID=UPI003672EC65
MPHDSNADQSQVITLRKPAATDGPTIWKLIRACKPLDENSLYANLIQAEHFRETSVIAEIGGEVVGWISGHIIPKSGDFFVWQVAVGEKARGVGLGKTMLLDLIARNAVKDAPNLQTTITKSNAASWGLFQSFARLIGGAMHDEPHFIREIHLDDAHPTEHLVTISLPPAADRQRG